MKKTILLTFCIAVLAMQSGLAQSDKRVPAVVTAAFMEKYPGIKVSDWDYQNDMNGYEAKFKLKGKEAKAWVGEDGRWIKTVTDLKLEELPPAVVQAMTTGDYKDWTLGDFREVDTPEGTRYKIKAKYGSQEHHLKYNEAGLLLEKTDAKAGGKKTLKY